MLQYDIVRNWDFGHLEQSYSERDAILYALSVGFGEDPINLAHLRYVWERDLRAVPSMAAILCSPGPWAMDERTGIDGSKIVHGEQDVEIFAPLPTNGKLHAVAHVSGISDKGAGRGALVEVTRSIYSSSEDLLARVRQVSFCRGDGGFSEGKNIDPWVPKALPIIPDRSPDLIVKLKSSRQSALLYRLNGDLNSLHVDPNFAEKLGYQRPILHGLCTFGMATYAVAHALCNMDATRVNRMSVRFSAPVFPGETVVFEIWRASSGAAHLRARVMERDAIVLNNGWFEYLPV